MHKSQKEMLSTRGILRFRVDPSSGESEKDQQSDENQLVRIATAEEMGLSQDAMSIPFGLVDPQTGEVTTFDIGQDEESGPIISQ